MSQFPESDGFSTELAARIKKRSVVKFKWQYATKRSRSAHFDYQSNSDHCCVKTGATKRDRTCAIAFIDSYDFPMSLAARSYHGCRKPRKREPRRHAPPGERS